MSSPEFASLEARVNHLRDCFIVDRDDYSQYTKEDHTKKLAFLVFASAAIEGYVEAHCVRVATEGIKRLKQGAPTSTGRALVAWSMTRGKGEPIPIHDTHFQLVDPGRADLALQAYGQSVKTTHGISARDFNGLISPLGAQPGQIPIGLADKFQELSDKRDPAVHVTIKSQSVPIAEYENVRDILGLLGQMELGLDTVLSSYPC